MKNLNHQIPQNTMINLVSKQKTMTLTTTPEITDHAHRRMCQRAITEEMIQLTLSYGRIFCKQGMEYYIMRRKDLPKHIHPELRHRMDNLVVLLSADGEIITCYRSGNGVKHLKTKTKILKGKKYAA